jgi:hypothetical protein
MLVNLPANYDACNNIPSFKYTRMGMRDNKAELLLKIIEHVSGYCYDWTSLSNDAQSSYMSYG